MSARFLALRQSLKQRLPAASRSEVWVCGRSLAGVAGSNRAGARMCVYCGVACSQVEVPATGRSLVRRSPTECPVSEYDIETSTMTRSRPITGHRSRNRTCCLLPSKFQSSFLRFVNKFAVYSVLNLAVIVTTISDSAASSRRLGTSITFQNILCPFARYWRPACVVVQWTWGGYIVMASSTERKCWPMLEILFCFSSCARRISLL